MIGKISSQILELSIYFEDANQNIWIGTRKGVLRYDPKSNSTHIFKQTDGLIQDRVRAIAQDQQGNMWFGTRAGISKYNGKTFTDYTERQGLSNNRVRKILLDASGSLWFGTYFGGACKFSDETFVHYTEEEGLISHQVFAIEPDSLSNSYWLGTFEGLEQIFLDNAGQLERIKVFPKEFKNKVNALAKSLNNSTIWIGTDDGLTTFDGKQTQFLNQEAGLAGNKVLCLSVAGPSGLWVGTDKGLSFINIENPQSAVGKINYQITNFLVGDPIYSIYRDHKNRLWLGNADGKVSLLKKGKPLSFTVPDITHHILEILQDPLGNIWMATEGDGLVRLNAFEQLTDTLDFQVYSVKHELASNFLHSMVFDADGNLWLGSEKGLDKIYFDHEQNIVRIRHFGKEEGFTGIETNRNSVAVDWKRNIWFGTIKGMTRFNKTANTLNFTPPQIHITDVSLSMLGTDWGNAEMQKWHQGTEGRFSLPKQLILPYFENTLLFSFTGISLKMPHKVEYQWMLEGYDYDWNAPSKKTDIIYANLPNGTYTFKVKACNEDGIWNETPATFTFSIEAPFWKEYWFYAVFILGTYLVFYTIFKWRTRRLEEAKKKLEHMVKKRTIEVSEKNAILEQQKEELHTTLEHIQLQKQTIEHERDTSEKLLLNILPKATAKELRENGCATPKFYEKVTVMFTDFKGFTQVAEKLTPTELVKELEQCFLGFDEILDKYELEKIKTIGDSYMCAGGVPIANETNPVDAIRAGLEIQQWMHDWQARQKAQGKPFWEVRIGINTGEIVAGVVGKKKFAYDIWGDAVNLASRMESSGEPGRVNISGITYELVKDIFDCEYRGKIQAKNKGEVDMYFVKAEKTS